VKGSYVFLGPSLSYEEAAHVFDGTILPPAARGDLAALFADGVIPDAVGLVDGKFLHEFAVTPKEVMAALATGTRLYGSSSMGALRAVECHPYGMVGVGRVFDLYLTGATDADDEVGITFDPDTLRATSEPLVNMRFAMAHAVGTSQISEATAAAVLAAAKEIFFPYRTYANVGAVLRGVIAEDERRRFLAFVSSPARPDQKRLDALELLAKMNDDGGRHDNQASSGLGGKRNGSTLVR
jgi:hypothetical protein